MSERDRDNYTRWERLQLRTVNAVGGLMMAAPPARMDLDQFEMTVVAIEDLSAHLRRITFSAPEFRSFTPAGPDEYFGLIVPSAGDPSVTMPPRRGINVRASVAAMPAEVRPELRWYTVRRHRPTEGEIDVDVVTHGDSGPGSAWACAAEVGFVAGFRAGAGSVIPTGMPMLLVADATAHPALCAIGEHLAARGHREQVLALVEAPDESTLDRVDLPFDVQYLFRGDAAPGSLVVPAVTEAPMPTPGFAWLCGESQIATSLRRLLVKDRGVARTDVLFSGYWKLGAARN